jgi:hypothetical protein
MFWKTMQQLIGALPMAAAGWMLDRIELPWSKRNFLWIAGASLSAFLGLWLIGAPVNTIARVASWKLERTAWAENNVWTQIGFTGVGISSVVIDPQNPQTINTGTEAVVGTGLAGILPAIPLSGRLNQPGMSCRDCSLGTPSR